MCPPISKLSLEHLEKSFSHWLSVLGYRPQTIQSECSKLRGLISYTLESGRSLSADLLHTYLGWLPSRPNERRGGNLSPSTVQGHYGTINLLLEYLKLVEGIEWQIDVPVVQVEKGKRIALSSDQIEQLYKVIDAGKDRLRDRAIMAVYYGCGLRRSEGMALKLSDLLFRKGLLLVRSGKGGKRRYVPMSGQVMVDLKCYIYEGRYDLHSAYRPYLFVSRKRNPLSGVSYDRRLHKWKQLAKIESPLSLHVLRHSIATHLLQRGMSLNLVSHFLGHASLVSTQVYTHLLNPVQ